MAIGFVVAGGNSMVLLEFTEEILDQTPRCVQFLIVFAWLDAVTFWRDDCRHARVLQQLKTRTLTL